MSLFWCQIAVSKFRTEEILKYEVCMYHESVSLVQRSTFSSATDSSPPFLLCGAGVLSPEAADLYDCDASAVIV